MNSINMQTIHHRFEATHNILSRQTLDRMHGAAVGILARTGIAVEHAEIRDAAAKRPGFSVGNGRIRISPERTEAWRNAGHKPITADNKARNDAPVTFSVSDRSFHIVDSDGFTVRPMTRDDVIKGAKLIAVLGAQGVKGVTPGVPCDVPTSLQPFEQFIIGSEYSPAGGSTSQITDIRTAELIREMNGVYGREFALSVWNPSPLILGGPELEILWHFRKEVKSFGVGSMPIMGITAPCDPIATFTLAMAECVGGAVIFNELLPDAHVSICPHPETADMRTGSMVMGTPEWELFDLMHRDVFEYYGQIRNTKMLHSTAPVPGVEAAVERAASAMNGILAGFRHFGPMGQLSLDEVFSPAMLLLDLDIVKHAQRIAEGVETGEKLDLEHLPSVIEDVVANGLIFAAHETTVANMRRQYREMLTLRRRNLAQWRQSGQPSDVREAYAESERLVARYSYTPPPDILNELRRIYDRARSELSDR